MAQMISQRNGRTGDALADWVRRFCDFKWNSEFSREMSRSCTEMVKDWINE